MHAELLTFLALAVLVEAVRDEAVRIEVAIDYQACSDAACRIPLHQTLSLWVPVAPLVGNTLAGRLAGTLPTTMNARWYLLRMVWRGLRRSPIGGLRYLARLVTQLAMRAPVGR